MNTDRTLQVTEIQRFCMHDGPGIRTTVFLKGCPLRCAWCHNPETQKKEAELLFYPSKCIECGGCASVCPTSAHRFVEGHFLDRSQCKMCAACAAVCPAGALEICGERMSVEDILEIVEKDRAFYGAQGGITLSGGEPFWQGEGVLSLLRACRERGLSTAVETCGYADSALLRAALPLVDLFLWDLKDTDDERHQRYTGVSNRHILENLRMMDEMGAKIRLRCILVNGVNTEEAHYERIAEIVRGLRGIEGVELIPYHAYGGTKATFLGGNDNGNKEWIPTDEQMLRAKAFLTVRGVSIVG